MTKHLVAGYLDPLESSEHKHSEALKCVPVLDLPTTGRGGCPQVHILKPNPMNVLQYCGLFHGSVSPTVVDDSMYNVNAYIHVYMYMYIICI